MKNVALFVFMGIFCFNSCSSNGTLYKKLDVRSYYVLRVHEKKVGTNFKEDPEFYCLLNIPNKDLRSTILNSYKSREDFLDTIFNKGNAKCILTYRTGYWVNICLKGKMNLSNFSPSDSLRNMANIEKVLDKDSYTYNDISIAKDKLLDYRIYVGIAKVKVDNMCTVFDRGFCHLPSDSIVIFNSPVRLKRYSLKQQF